MPVLEYSYNWPLVAASLAISIMAAFTGLALTRGIGALPAQTRQIRIAMAAVALGGGIWSMHFVAILAMRFPIQLTYHPLLTLGSALVAVLLAGLALLVMHYAPRNRRTITLAGVILGLGIVAMHYIGMQGIERCLPVYGPLGIAGALLLSILFGVGAIATAYGVRTHRNTVLATLIFGASVVVVHFVAMADTSFLMVDVAGLALPEIDDTTLALIVMFSAFLICGAFLLSGANFVVSRPVPAAAAGALPETDPRDAQQSSGGTTVRVPYELNGQTAFQPAAEIASLRAEGHYTIAYMGNRKLFCPWSISEAEKRLPASMFQRVHRSYLVNLSHVTGFERRKDTGVCLLQDGETELKVPVSRTRISDLRQALGI